ncbi:MAG: hypothetical protein LAP21_10815 [Acidobacteriia bacterium]|nr:hypothetical protein [Terriglobia bacterium]
MLRGAGLVQGAVALTGVLLVCLFAFSSERAALVRDMLAAAARMLSVYLPYAAVALIAFAVRLLPSVDFRSATSVFVFGPMTALRPIVALAGVIYGILPATRTQTSFLAVIVLALLFAVQGVLDRAAARESDATLPVALSPAID